MSEKSFKIVDGDISDGYHTFDELYDHRCLLFLIWLTETGKHQNRSVGRDVYWVENHFPGWDLVATNVGRKQISYHIPAKYRHITSRFVKRDKAEMESLFDGHTSPDVLRRIEEYLL